MPATELGKRAASGIPLAIFCTWLLLVGPNWLLHICISSAVAIAAWEWARLTDIRNNFWSCLYALVIVGVAWAVYLFGNTAIGSFLMVTSALWSLVILALIVWPKWLIEYALRQRWLSLTWGVLALVATTVTALIMADPSESQTYIFEALVRSTGSAAISSWRLLLFVLCLATALADVGAYFAGKKFGKHALHARVSPGKTWQGLAGGWLASSVTIYIATATNLLQLSLLEVIASATLVTVVGVLGDLFESALKRSRNVKDSSTLLPGHGGVLDRCDGYIPLLPLMLLLMGLK